mmetsp:Transcript_13566/g.29037  ORF Transcript_13566/g.29037 Transcript_13566/m.29037 type:complete len:94 (-) Transcript_13566:670-951(-)
MPTCTLHVPPYPNSSAVSPACFNLQCLVHPTLPDPDPGLGGGWRNMGVLGSAALLGADLHRGLVLGRPGTMMEEPAGGADTGAGVAMLPDAVP